MRLKVFLVEDDDVCAATITKRLEQHADVVRVTNLGDCASAGTADIALLDLHLPDSIGPDTVSRFRELLPLMPIVVLTSVDDPRMEAAAKAAGAHAYFQKDQYSTEALLRSMNSAVIAFEESPLPRHDLAFSPSAIGALKALMCSLLARLDSVSHVSGQ